MYQPGTLKFVGTWTAPLESSPRTLSGTESLSVGTQRWIGRDRARNVGARFGGAFFFTAGVLAGNAAPDVEPELADVDENDARTTGTAPVEKDCGLAVDDVTPVWPMGPGIPGPTSWPRAPTNRSVTPTTISTRDPTAHGHHLLLTLLVIVYVRVELDSFLRYS